MSVTPYSDELHLALARPDADKLICQLDAYADHFARGAGDWSEEHSADFSEIIDSGYDDPEKALAYVIIAADRSDDAKFLGLIGCGLLEDLLRDPSPELLERVVAEARKSARFRWLLSNPWRIAISEAAWGAIEKFRVTGPREEPSDDILPKRH